MLINVTGFDEWATRHRVKGYDFLCFEALLEACEAAFTLKYPKMPSMVEILFDEKIEDAQGIPCAGQHGMRWMSHGRRLELIHILLVNPSCHGTMKGLVKTLIHEFNHAVGKENLVNSRVCYDYDQLWRKRPEEIRVVFEVNEVFGSVWSGFMERLGRGSKGNARKHRNHLRRFVREPLPPVMKGWW